MECKGVVREEGKGSGSVGGEGGGKKEEWNKLPKTKPDGELSGNVPAQRKRVKGVPKDLEWIDAEGLKEYSEMGTPETTAQVHPYQFTTALAELATEAGAEIFLGKATSLNYTSSSSSAIESVTYTDSSTNEPKTIEATDVILAAGPWTTQLLPKAPIDAMRAHSVVIKADVAPYAIFSEIELPKDFNRTGGQGVKKRRHGLRVSPEMYARPDGTVYACGMFSYLFSLPLSLLVPSCSYCKGINVLTGE